MVYSTPYIVTPYRVYIIVYSDTTAYNNDTCTYISQITITSIL